MRSRVIVADRTEILPFATRVTCPPATHTICAPSTPKISSTAGREEDDEEAAAPAPAAVGVCDILRKLGEGALSLFCEK